MSTSVTVRAGSRVGACTELGSLVYETTAAYVFRRPDGEIAFISKRSPALHMAPCIMCRDDHQHQEPREAA